MTILISPCALSRVNPWEEMSIILAYLTYKFILAYLKYNVFFDFN